MEFLDKRVRGRASDILNLLENSGSFFPAPDLLKFFVDFIRSSIDLADFIGSSVAPRLQSSLTYTQAGSR